MTANTNWIEVDRAGLAQIIADRPKCFILFELIQNALDEKTKEIKVTFRHADHRQKWWIEVEDDSPDGYQDIRDAWTMYAPSKKKANAEKRGRFNQGCKMVLALAEAAEVISTKSAVAFTSKGRQLLRDRREHGTMFRGLFRMTDHEAADAYSEVFKILPPKGVTIEVVIKNTVETVQRSEPLKTFETTLPTVFADADGNLRNTRRRTVVELHEPDGNEKPTLYEMGIPVVELDGNDPYHINVGQRVPLNTDRDNVTPAYLRQLRVEVLNAMHERLTEDEAQATWATEASEDPRAAAEAVTSVLDKRFGKKRVSFDPSDPEANKIAVSRGYTVIPGRSLTRGQWENARTGNLVRPAGQVTPSPRVESSPDGIPPVASGNWSGFMQRMAEYARWLAGALHVSSDLRVTWYSSRHLTFAAAWGSGLSLNKDHMGKRIAAWCNGDRAPFTALLIHEFAHDKVSDHLSSEYHEELCRLGSLLLDINPPDFET